MSTIRRSVFSSDADAAKRTLLEWAHSHVLKVVSGYWSFKQIVFWRDIRLVQH